MKENQEDVTTYSKDAVCQRTVQNGRYFLNIIDINFQERLKIAV